MKLRIGILVGTKGRGSNMANLVEACRSGALDAEVCVVAATSADSPALARAAELGVKISVVRFDGEFGHNVLQALQGCDVLCLAGFLRLLPPSVLAAFPDRVLNVHPALLPKFGGPGMYGQHVHTAVLAAKENVSGASIHLVNERYDEGKVLIQVECEVKPDDTAESLASRVLE
ncbi:MAG: phosphoribosylglycinamide formyltransferase, partial [Fimbriimonadaceae bacterium]